jgi:hypothetical protein
MTETDELEALLAAEEDILDEKSFFEVADLNKIIAELSDEMQRSSKSNDPRLARQSVVDKHLLSSLDDLLVFHDKLKTPSRASTHVAVLTKPTIPSVSPATAICKSSFLSFVQNLSCRLHHERVTRSNRARKERERDV